MKWEFGNYCRGNKETPIDAGSQALLLTKARSDSVSCFASVV